MVLLLFVDPEAELDPELRALRPLGAYFVLRTVADLAHAPRPGPVPLAEAYGATTSDVYRDRLGFRVRKVARALSAPEERIAASVAQLGLAARLWSVALGSAAVYGRIPDLGPRLLGWDPDASAPDDLWLTEVRPLPGDAATVAAAVLDAHLEPLAAAVRSRHRVAAGLLWGNAASALTGAARRLDRWARAEGRPDVAARSGALTRRLLTDPRLAGTGTLTGTAFRRRSCCLYYRLPGGGLCGDCCFTRAPAAR
ncbi:(2Fe-2S)-binding protein [Streptomyces sp. B93]|uniref:(2Fe-2S)-binding protein n=1 Tax=Streptomyces sp. B93 TaxID=2824875 RepID=UPI001B369702|nr:(2Fe-2S)-binding protein [Streptomyces sp. B93]MBQ1094467.1 (2Fe-2S)-binding protein [Streptomyces sp. B93]